MKRLTINEFIDHLATEHRKYGSGDAFLDGSFRADGLFDCRYEVSALAMFHGMNIRDTPWNDARFQTADGIRCQLDELRNAPSAYIFVVWPKANGGFLITKLISELTEGRRTVILSEARKAGE